MDYNSQDRDTRDRQGDGQSNSNRGRRWDNNRGQGNSERAEEGVGIPIPITHSKITKNINTQIPVIIVHLQWDISTDIKYPMNKILHTRHSLPNTSRNKGEHNPTGCKYMSIVS